jgi:hypothetical protein
LRAGVVGQEVTVFLCFTRYGPYRSWEANVSKPAWNCRTVEEINTLCGYFPHVEILSIPLGLIMAL